MVPCLRPALPRTWNLWAGSYFSITALIGPANGRSVFLITPIDTHDLAEVALVNV